jgi:murein L,D-transpeptidase YafK
MKDFYTLESYIFVSCMLVLMGISTGAPTPVPAKQFSISAGDMAHLFKVAAAKEPIYLILVEKDLQLLRVIEYDDELRVVAEYPSATGEKFGIKEASGDERTPEGVYFITHIYKDDKITIFGDKAFHLDYPNFFDIEAGRDGDGIYIHGTNKELEPNSTNGCVTLANNDLDDLEKYLNQVVTPVVIVPRMDSVKVNTSMLTENDFRLTKSLLLLDGIKTENVEYNYLYVISYDGQTVAVSDFIYRPFNQSIMRGASRTYLKNLPGKGWTSAKRVWRASPLQIYPETPVKIAARPFTTDETELAEQGSEETALLVAALNQQAQPETVLAPSSIQNPSKPVPAKPAPQPLKKSRDEALSTRKAAQKSVHRIPVAQSTTTPSPQKETRAKIAQLKKLEIQDTETILSEQQVLDFVENWRLAWTSKQIEPYIAFYDRSFRSGNKDLEGWKAHKAKLNRTYSYISVEISDIDVRWTDAGATVSFKQEYRSDLFKAAGIKTLHLVYSDLGWKIKRETFSRI